MNIYTIGVLISILIYILIGNYSGKKVKNLDDYYVGGRNAGTIFITGTMFASMLSTNGFMGDAGFAYSGHITLMIIINTLCAAGYILGPLFFGRYIRRVEVNTMPEYFAKRFNSRPIQRLAGITTVLSLMAYLIAVIQGTAILMKELTGLSYELSLILSWITFTSFTFYSGSNGVILTDTIMCSLFLFATILAGPYIFKQLGGINKIIPNILNSNLDKNLISYHGVLNSEYKTAYDAISYSITMGLVWLITVSVSPWQAGRNLMAKNEHVTFRAGSLSVVLTTVFLSFLYFIALSINLVNPNIVPSEKVIIWACLEMVSPIIGVLVLTGIMAAGLSSASTFLSVAGFSMTQDVIAKDFKNPKKELSFSRIIMLLVGIISLSLAYILPPNIRIISWFASTIIAASWGPVAFMSVWSKKITKDSAYWGMLLGLLGQLLGNFLDEFTALEMKNFFHPFFIGIYLNFIGIYLASLKSKKTKEEKDFHKRMLVIPEEEKDPTLYKEDKKYAILLIFTGLFIVYIGLKFWALPIKSIS